MRTSRRIVLAALLSSAAACGHDAPSSSSAAKPQAGPKVDQPSTPTPTTPPAPPALPAAFAESLRRGGLTFTMPAGYTAVPTVDNAQWKYDFAMRSADGTVEVRIRVDPLDQALAEEAKCKQDPSCHGTDPNQRAPTWLMVIAANIAGGNGGLPDVKQLPATNMRAEYGADFGAVTEVVPGAEMKSEHHNALVFLLHKDDKADAVFAVFHDGLREDQLPSAIQGLRFAP